MAETTKTSALDRALAASRASYQQMMERAEQALEAARTAHSQKIQETASRIATLEYDLGLMEGFERERDAARIRLELHEAELAHRANVAEADQALETAARHYLTGLSSYGMAAEASFNANLVQFRREDKQS